MVFAQVPTASPLPEPDVEYIVPAPSVILPPVLVVEYFSPAPAVFSPPEPVVEYSSSVLAEFQSRSSFHPYFWSPNRQCQWWRTLHPRQQCFLFHNLTDKFQQLDVELMSVVEVVRALSDKVTDSFRLMDLPIAEQLIEVPKVSSSSCPSRAVLREPQMAEQLVEVPTVLSPALLQQVEQIVDNPAPRGRGARGGLPSFLPGQDLQHSVEQIVDTPVPGRVAPSGRLYTRQSSSQRTVEQTPDIPVPGRGGHVGVSRNRFQRRHSGAERVHGALQSSRPGQGSIASSGTQHGHGTLHGSRRVGRICWRSSRLCPRTGFNSSWSS